MSVKLRLLLIVAMAALPAFLLTAWFEVQDRRHRTDSAEEQLLRSARLLAAQQGQFFARAEAILSTMLHALADDWQDTGACNAYLLRLAAQSDAYTGFGVATPDGVIVCSSLPEQMLGVNIGDRDYIQNAIASGGFAIGGIQTGMATGRIIVGLASPYIGIDGNVALVGVSGLALIGLSDVIAAALPPPGVALVFDREGTIVARSPDPHIWIGQTVAGEHLELARAGGGAESFVGIDGEPRLWAVHPLGPREGLYVGLGVPIGEFLAQADMLFWRQLILLSIVFAATAFAAIIVSDRVIRRPIVALEKTVGRMRRGDLSARNETVGSAPEFVHLGKSFDEMAEALQKHESELATIADQRALLVREMNHRIKNSLQIVSGLIGIQRDALVDTDLKEKLAEVQARIAAVAKVHERLYASEQLNVIDAGRYLRELCSDLGDSTGWGAAGGVIECHADPVTLPPDQAIPLGIITTELATNAMKHAYPGAAGPIAVDFRSEDGVSWRLTVSDSGSGMPVESDTETGAGLGIKVVRALTRQLGASLKVVSPTEGTSFVVERPRPGRSDAGSAEPPEADEPARAK